MDVTPLAEADRIIASLGPARREAVRELIIGVIRRGVLDDRARSTLDAYTGGPFVGDVLAAAIAASAAAASAAPAEVPASAAPLPPPSSALG